MLTLTRIEITNALAEYEMSHPVNEYTIKGVHIWPILRIQAGFDLYIGKTNSQAIVSNNNLSKKGIRKLKTFFSTYSHWKKACRFDSIHEYPPDLKGRDLVFLSYSNNRRAIIDGGWYDIFVDSLVEQLSNHNFSVLVWELTPGDDYRLPRYSSSALISYRLSWTNRIAHLRSMIDGDTKEPKWFKEYAAWLVSLGGSQIKYQNITYSMHVLLRQAKVFEKWLIHIRPRALFVICWHSLECMAALLAAFRLGIETVDFQHGLQGAGDFAYASWKKSPQSGYEMLPKYFWTWGEMDAHSIRSTSSLVIPSDRVIIGGYPWLNLWRYDQELPPCCSKFVKEAKCLTDRQSRSILVTFQGNDPLEDIQDLFQAIQESPCDWQWLLRLHPLFLKDKDRIDALAQKTNHPNINIEQASQLPLYALLKTVNIHVTWWSTCALECIPFGIRTILIHENGKEAFTEFIRQGHMVFANGKDEIIYQISASKHLDSTISDNTVFAGKTATKEAMNKLLCTCDQKE